MKTKSKQIKRLKNENQSRESIRSLFEKTSKNIKETKVKNHSKTRNEATSFQENFKKFKFCTPVYKSKRSGWPSTDEKLNRIETFRKEGFQYSIDYKVRSSRWSGIEGLEVTLC